jgi:hypothetical protein
MSEDHEEATMDDRSRGEGGDLAACRALAAELRAAGLADLAAELEVLNDPVKARRVASLLDERGFPDD